MRFFVIARPRPSAFVAALFCVFAYSVPLAAQKGNPVEGQKLFVQNCAQCHGPDGSASTAVGKSLGAKDLRAAATQKLTDAQIATQIEKGKGNMPPFGAALNKEKVNNLIAFVRGLGKKQVAAKKT